MRKALLIIACAAAALSVAAAPLTPEEALSRAARQGAGPARALARNHGSYHLVETASMPRLQMAGVYLYAAQSRTGGSSFLLLAADDVAAPVLGYADEGTTLAGAEIPVQLQWLMDQYAREIEWAVSHGKEPYRAPQYQSDSRSPIPPLVQVTWNQDAPYNDLCPKINGQATMTGCAATAMAQVMKYFNYPASARHTFNYTTQDGANYKWAMNVTFDWTNMLPAYGTGDYNTTQATAVATLMKACGYSLNMSYGTDASGALSSDYPEAFTKIFGYDSNIAILSRINYPLATWQEMVYNNLASVGPLIMSGSSNTGGGHAFVCDGYSSSGYYHFNWGWEGAYDGYYLLTALNPDGQGIGGFAGGYNIGTDAVFNIQLPGQTTLPVQTLITCYEIPTGSVSGSTITLSGGWYNLTGFAISSIDLCLKFVNVATGAIAYSSPHSGLSASNYSGWSSLSGSVPSSLANGSYRVSVVYRTDSGSWHDCAHSINMPDYVVMKKQGSSYTVTDQEDLSLTATAAQLLTPLYYGKASKMSYTFKNNEASEVQEAVAPCLLNSSYQLVAVGDCEVIDLQPGESYSNTVVTEWGYTSNFTAGESYTVGLYDPEAGLLLATHGDATVANAPATTVSATTFSLQGGTSGVMDVSNLKFDATLRCTKGYFAAAPEVYIGQDTGSGNISVLATYNAPEYMFLTAGQSESTTIEANFAQAAPNSTYYAFLFGGNDQLKYLSFTTGQTLGVAEIAVSNREFLSFVDRQTGRVHLTAPDTITEVTVTTLSGRRAVAPVVSADASATVDLSGYAPGLYFVTLRTASGATHTAKVVR